MNKIEEFINEQFGAVRVIVIGGELWFVAKDVCEILGIKNPTDAVNKGLEEFERARFNLGRQGEANIISESGFYTLVLRSRKPIAKPFRLWVTQEVIPQIRKTDGYIPAKQDDSPELIMAKAIKIADTTIKELKAEIDEKDTQIEQQKPMIDNYKVLMETKNTFNMNQVAHLCGIGEYELFRYLREFNVLFYDQNHDNVPYETPTNKTKFLVVATVSPDGHTHSQTRVTPSGVGYICDLLRKHNLLEVTSC